MLSRRLCYQVPHRDRVRVLTCCCIFSVIVAYCDGQATAQDVDLRTWRDATGQYSVLASFVRQTKDSVILLTADGRRINVRIARLSDPDKAFLLQRARETDGPADTSDTEAAISKRLAGPPLPGGKTLPLPELARMLGIPAFVDVYSLRGRRMLVGTPVELSDGFATLQEQLEEDLARSHLGMYRARTILVLTERRAAEKMTEPRLYRVRTPQNFGGVKTIIQRLERTEPTSWESRGGYGAVSHLGGIYAVSQSLKVHRLLVADLNRSALPSRYRHPLEEVSVTIAQDRVSMNDVLDAVRQASGRDIEVRVDEEWGYHEDDFAERILNLKLTTVSAYDILDVTLRQLEHTWREEGQKIIVLGTEVAEEQLESYEFDFPITPRITANDVMATLEICVEQDSWEAIGGEGQIQVLRNNMLRVRQGEPAMRKVKRFVHDLKAAFDGR